MIEKNSINCDSCLANNFVYIAQHITNISEADLLRFFKCCCKKCSNNVEFSEFGGGLMYRLLSEQTDLTMKVLGNVKDLDMNYIELLIQNPVDDGIDIDFAINKIRGIKGNQNLKNRILKSLNIAKEKM